MSDEALTTLDAARRGDQRAAERLYRDHNPMLMRYLRSQEGAIAEDLAAEVWLAAARGLPGFVGDERGFRSWLFTIARRRVIEHRRRGVRRRTDPVDPGSFATTPVGDDVADLATDLATAQDAVELMSAHLSADQAEVLVLRVVADLSAAQVAELTGHTEAWVRMTQHRALKRLQAIAPTALEVAP